MSRLVAVLATALLLGQPVLAAGQEEPLSWLERISSAAQRLNYSGVFVYQSGPISEISRVTHFVDERGEHEHLEVLDGSPRQVIRSNDEVWCIFPERKTVIEDRSGVQRSFPARLPTALSRIAENYELRLGRVSRVAGFDAQAVMLEPRDDLRYGHVLWADMASGLLLKAQMVDEGGAMIEQFKFSDVRIGDVEPVSGIATLNFREEPGWKVVSAHGADVGELGSGWRLAEELPGYVLESVVKRPLGRGQRDVLHMIYSDGLASISVFIEPQENSSDRLGPLQSGAIHIHRRSVAGHLVTALGEVPMRALVRVADHMEPVSQ